MKQDPILHSLVMMNTFPSPQTLCYIRFPLYMYVILYLIFTPNGRILEVVLFLTETLEITCMPLGIEELNKILNLALLGKIFCNLSQLYFKPLLAIRDFVMLT